MDGKFDPYLDTEEYKQNADRAIKAYLKGNPAMLGLYQLFPDMFIEQVRVLSYYSNLGLFWEVMAPVFFEMSDLYDEGKITSVPEAMDFLANGIFAVAGRPIYHHVYIDGEMIELIQLDGYIHLVVADNGKGFTPNQNTTGFGLQGIRERTTSLYGSFTIDSQREFGSRLFISLPLANHSTII